MREWGRVCVRERERTKESSEENIDKTGNRRNAPFSCFKAINKIFRELRVCAVSVNQEQDGIKKNTWKTNKQKSSWKLNIR